MPGNLNYFTETLPGGLCYRTPEYNFGWVIFSKGINITRNHVTDCMYSGLKHEWAISQL